MSGNAEVLVLGGGLAGSIASVQLARGGRAVTLLEKSKGAHDKVCGEFLSYESVLYLEQHGLHPRHLGGVPIRSVRLVTPGFQQERALPFEAWSLTRKTLDAAMLEQASSAGVRVIQDAWVTALQPDRGGWSATLRDGTSFQANNAVLATGKLDVSGWPRPQGMQPGLIAFKMYFCLTEAQHRDLGDAVELLVYPGGYAGLQPVEGGRVNLCLLIDPRRLQGVGTQWDAVLRHLTEHVPHLRQRLQGAVATLDRPLAASRIPYGHVQRTTEHGLWRVGDQAAVIPSFAGEGTAIALHSGLLAAERLLRVEQATAFQRMLHRQLAPRVLLATGVSRLLVEHPWATQAVRLFPPVLDYLAAITRIPARALAMPNARLGEERHGGGA